MHDLCFSHFQLFHNFDKKMRLQDTIAVRELVLIFSLLTFFENIFDSFYLNLIDKAISKGIS